MRFEASNVNEIIESFLSTIFIFQKCEKWIPIKKFYNLQIAVSPS
jgi:hypothetical protein